MKTWEVQEVSVHQWGTGKEYGENDDLAQTSSNKGKEME